MIVEKASPNNSKIIAELCILAEGSPNKCIPFQKIFDLSEDETKKLFVELAKYDEENIPYSYTSYYLLKDENGKVIGGCSAWIEEDFPTEKIVLQILADILGYEKIRQYEENIRAASELAVPRSPDSLQLECIAVLPEYQGKGFGKILLTKVMEEFKNKTNSAEIIVMKNNIKAIKFYEKLGFKIVEEKSTTNPKTKEIYGASAKVKTAKKL